MEQFEDGVIDEFLEGQPRSETWRSLRVTLQERLTVAREQLKESPENASLKRKVRELETQVAALLQEEIVTEFVENSVRATIARPHPLYGEIEDI